MSLQNYIRTFWQKRGLLNWILLPLSGLYWIGFKINQFFKKTNPLLSVPVVIVGCLTVGGGGKTTLVEALSKSFTKRGKKVGIILRGYKSKSKTSKIVLATDTAKDVGDEAAMLYKHLQIPVAIGIDRYASAKLLLSKFPETQMLISDDGLQHKSLPRNFEIVVMSEYELGNRFLLPAGPLREPASRLSTVDAIVKKQSKPKTSEFALTLSVPKLFDVDENEINSDQLAHKKVAAVAGIAEPSGFFTSVKNLGIAISKQVIFPDHHSYTKDDLAKIDCDCIIMTAKDAIKCKQFEALQIIELRCEPVVDETLITKISDHVS